MALLFVGGHVVRPVEFIKVGLNRQTLLLFIVFIKNFEISNITFNNTFFKGKKNPSIIFFSFLEKWVFLNKLSPSLKLEIIRDENENFKK